MAANFFASVSAAADVANQAERGMGQGCSWASICDTLITLSPSRVVDKFKWRPREFSLCST